MITSDEIVRPPKAFPQMTTVLPIWMLHRIVFRAGTPFPPKPPTVTLTQKPSQRTTFASMASMAWTLPNSITTRQNEFPPTTHGLSNINGQ